MSKKSFQYFFLVQSVPPGTDGCWRQMSENGLPFLHFCAISALLRGLKAGVNWASMQVALGRPTLVVTTVKMACYWSTVQIWAYLYTKFGDLRSYLEVQKLYTPASSWNHHDHRYMTVWLVSVWTAVYNRQRIKSWSQPATLCSGILYKSCLLFLPCNSYLFDQAHINLIFPFQLLNQHLS